MKEGGADFVRSPFSFGLASLCKATDSNANQS